MTSKGDWKKSNYPLRPPKDVFEEARAIAKDQGVSMNAFLSSLVAERVGELRALCQLRIRALVGDVSKAQAVLSRAPDRPPFAGDERMK